MEHDEIRALLGAYALDAVEPNEGHEVEIHLRECPRCDAEVAAYREVATLLGNSTVDAPPDAWDRLASRVAGAGSLPSWPEFREHLPRSPRRASRRRRTLVGVGSALVAAAAVSLALLGVRVGNLNHEVAHYRSLASTRGLSGAVAAALAGPHRTIELAAVREDASAKIVLAPDDEAYWVASSLPSLAPGKTYQLWALANGAVVSLGVIGTDPHRDTAFVVQKTMRSLMVTVEPEGGTTRPTTPVLVSGALPT